MQITRIPVQDRHTGKVYLSMSAAARELGVTQPTIRNYVTAGKFKELDSTTKKVDGSSTHLYVLDRWTGKVYLHKVSMLRELGITEYQYEQYCEKEGRFVTSRNKIDEQRARRKAEKYIFDRVTGKMYYYIQDVLNELGINKEQFNKMAVYENRFIVSNTPIPNRKRKRF